MSAQASISEFLQQAGYQLRIFDLSRQVQKLAKADFLAWEQGQQPWPLPLLGQAQLALIFWNQQNRSNPQIWFLHLPLDAQGLLIGQARDDVLLRIIQSVGDHLEHKAEADRWLQQNPYALEVPPERRAVLNAKVRQLLKLPASDALKKVQRLLAESTFNWAELPFQGLAELALQQKNKTALTAQCRLVEVLPAGAFASFACCLENEPLGPELSSRLIERVQRAAAAQDIQEIAAGLQALANSKNARGRQQLIDQLLVGPEGAQLAVLSVLAGRCWRDLCAPQRLQLFLENLARVESRHADQVFCRMVQDLGGIAELRGPLMQALRNPERSEALGRAIGLLFSAGN